MALPQPDAGGDLERLAPVSRGLPETVGPAAGVEELTSEVHVVALWCWRPQEEASRAPIGWRLRWSVLCPDEEDLGVDLSAGGARPLR